MKYVRTYKVMGAEIGPDYRLKEHLIGMYFQECFAEYTASKQVAAYDVAKSGLTWLTGDSVVEFTHPMPFWRDEIEVSAWFWKIGGVRMYVNFTAKSGDREIARACSVQLIADSKIHKPQRADKIAALFELDDQAVFGNDIFGKIEMFDNGCCADCGTTQISQIVRFDDLDFNMHLNNVRYIPRALESIPIEYRNSHILKRYRIKYEHESKFGDEIISRCTQRGNEFTHILLRNSDNVELCSMQSKWESNSTDG